MKLDEVVSVAKRFLFRRKLAYIQTFSGAHGEVVLRDLAKFCRAHVSTFNADPRVAAQLDGRREVWLRITQHINIPEDKFWQLYGRPDLDQ